MTDFMPKIDPFDQDSNTPGFNSTPLPTLLHAEDLNDISI